MTQDEALRVAMDWYGSGNQDPDEFEKLIKAIAAQRTWVGLTDKERNQLWRDVVKWGDPSHDDVELIKAIEAKLKEKNERTL
jgi:hypothetical protein